MGKADQLMKLLHSCFGGFPNKYYIKEWIKEKRVERNDDCSFFRTTIQHFGGRGHNEFLDYGLMALKFVHFFEGEQKLVDASKFLLFFDRHDLWQNLPYIVEEFNRKQMGNSN